MAALLGASGLLMLFLAVPGLLRGNAPRAEADPQKAMDAKAHAMEDRQVGAAPKKCRACSSVTSGLEPVPADTPSSPETGHPEVTSTA